MMERDLPQVYRDMAVKLRRLADTVPDVPDVREDLLEMSARFERMAVYYSAQATNNGP